MDNLTIPKPPQNANATPQILPPLIESIEPEPFFSVKFIVFGVLALAAAVIGAEAHYGKINLSQYFSATKTAPPATAPAQFRAGVPVPPAAPAVPSVPPPPSGTFVVTSISLGQPSFAIINGLSRVVGDPVEDAGVTGWKVDGIADGVVYLRNGTTVAAVPLTQPGLKPLNDELHPLN